VTLPAIRTRLVLDCSRGHATNRFQIALCRRSRLVDSRTYSPLGEIDAADSGAYRYSVTRDAAGRIATRTETLSGVTHEWGYAYDALGRLVRVARDGELAESYAYDDQGNRISYRVPLRGVEGSVTPVIDPADRLVASSEETRSYTDEGELESVTTSAGTTTYRYTGLSELSSVALPDGREVSYRHDAKGARVARLIDGVVVERYEWAGTRLLATFDGAGHLTRRFLYADARMPCAMDTAEGRQFLHYDQTGSLRAVTDEAGAVMKAVSYDSFGVLIEDSAPGLEVPFGFAGGLTDPDTGLVHFGARDYDPAQGRWLSRDPIGLSGGDVNLYGYCLSDPVNLVDPSGLWPSTLDTPSGRWVMAQMAMEAVGTAVDVVDTARSFADCNASAGERGFNVAMLAVGAVAPGGGYGQADEALRLKKALPNQWHHMATNKSLTYTPRMAEIAERFGLSLSGDWNKRFMAHLGRHPNEYHEFVLKGMQDAASGAGGDPERFVALFNDYVIQPVLQQPGMLGKDFWR